MNTYTCTKCNKVTVKYSNESVMQSKCCDGDNLVEQKLTPGAQPKPIDVKTVMVPKQVVVELPPKSLNPGVITNKPNTSKSMTVTEAPPTTTPAAPAPAPAK